jgi:hypothetical protein
MVGFRLRSRFRSAVSAFREPPDRHVLTSAPSPQNALDIFRGTWTSKLPPPLDRAEAGPIPLFQDDRLAWGLKELGVRNRSVLELGPLEGGHTYMLANAGASSVVSIEGDTRNYLKCLVTKELFQLQRVNFLCGNVVEYLRTTAARFDLCIASGVLYDMLDPVELIARIAMRCSSVYVWTHYYDKDVCANNPDFDHKGRRSEYAGFKYTLHRVSRTASWMSRDELLTCFRRFGLPDITVAHETRDPPGPSFSFIAEQRLSRFR